MPITIYDAAVARAAKEGKPTPETMGDFDALGLPMLGGCQICGACIAAYNACPSTTGYLMCSSGCIGDRGFRSAESFEGWSAWQEEESRGDDDDDSGDDWNEEEHERATEQA